MKPYETPEARLLRFQMTQNVMSVSVGGEGEGGFEEGDPMD